MKKLLLASMIASAWIHASAQAVAVAGEAATPCGEYLEDRNNNNWVKNNYVAVWVRGYLSGYNMFTVQPKIAQIPEAETVWAYLDKYCRNNPLSFVIQGSDSLIDELGGYRSPHSKNKN